MGALSIRPTAVLVEELKEGDSRVSVEAVVPGEIDEISRPQSSQRERGSLDIDPEF